MDLHIVKFLAYIGITACIFIVTFQFGKIASSGVTTVPANCPPPETIVKTIVVESEAVDCNTVKQPVVFKLDYKQSKSKGVLEEVFGMIHHPDGPVASELLFTDHHIKSKDDPYADCNNIVLTRTGSLANMPATKCVAIVKVPDKYNSPYSHSHRYGTMSGLTDQYQADYIDQGSYKTEQHLLELFVRNLDKTVGEFKRKMGDPLMPDGSRRFVIIIVANEGVIDLLMNFLCSCRQAGISVENLVVFLGQPEYGYLIESMGAKTFYHEALGPIPKKAAGAYGDSVFGLMMWMKTTSVYIASRAGFDVVFQDADLVWLEDPLPELQSSVKDFAFMDDGARTARFTPFFVNSGFYFQKYNKNVEFLMERMMKAMFEVALTHSHQSVLTHEINEAHDLIGLQLKVLSLDEFPSGIVYHHNKKFIGRLTSFQEFPKVFHMCWTSSRNEKVTYFKDIGMWFLPYQGDKEIYVNSTDDRLKKRGSDQERISVCNDASKMSEWLNTDRISGKRSADGSSRILDKCCTTGKYWAQRMAANIPRDHK